MNPSVPTILAKWLRSAVRLFQTDRSGLGAAERFLRAIAVVPVFGALLVVLRLSSACGARFSFDARIRSGHRFQCNPPDLVQMYMWVFDIWEPDLTDFISRQLRAGDGFVDVGANVGYFSILASGLAGGAGPVLAIEASPEVFRHLQGTIRNNECSGARLLNVAASDKPGTLDVYGGPSHNIGLTTTVGGRGFAKQATVEALPLDDLLLPEELAKARLVKIDVEGGEVAVLAGMTRLLKEGRSDLEILVEVSPLWWNEATTPREILRPLLETGFNVYQMENSYWPWRYLWPRDVRRPQRLRDLRTLDRRPKRLDLVLSRKDSDEL